ncbi:MAG TPA: ATPase, T2SS/T4P/T4SS family [Candidatus Nanoarchaeia archaeon]|nr:ATPase, T2SS/T4P/T4SS family [Candidatus Nanoarchaeia archaeon]
MALFDKKACFSYEIIQEGDEKVLRIDCNECTFTASVEDSPLCMSKAIEILAQIGGVTRIVFFQKKDYEYDYNQTVILSEVAQLYKRFTSESQLSFSTVVMASGCDRYLRTSYATLQQIVFSTLKSDPVSAYVQLKRLHRSEKITEESMIEQDGLRCVGSFVKLLDWIIDAVEKMQIIVQARPYITAHKAGDRDVYRKLFHPLIRPDFMYAKLMASYPLDGEVLDSYSIGDTEVTIFGFPDDVKTLYHVIPPEFKFSEEKYELLDSARRIMSEHKPSSEEFVDPERMREVFYNVGRDLIVDLMGTYHLQLTQKEIDELAQVLLRYTVGFGLIEVLLSDPKIQDLSINSPMGEAPIFLVHQDFDDCITNIIPTPAEAEGWATKLRLISGRPLDEANPILDTELKIPGMVSRVAAVSRPLNPYGLSYSFRRHRDKPWTLPLFIKSKMIDSLGAGLLSFFIDGTRTMLVAGTRSSGKTSLLGSFLVEIMRRYRIITIEDSVTGDAEMIIKRNGKFERTTIGELVDGHINDYGYWYNLTDHEITGNREHIEVFAMDKQGKIKLAKPTKLIRHKVSKPIYKVITRTGREIKVTGDHSLFTLDGTDIKEIKTKDLHEGSRIAVPRMLPLQNLERRSMNILPMLYQGFIISSSLNLFLNDRREEVMEIGRESGYCKSTIQRWIRLGILPVHIAHDLGLSSVEGQFKLAKNSAPMPLKIEFTREFLTFVGLWIADGCYDKNSVIISVGEPEEQALVHAIAAQFGCNVKKHSDEFSLMLNSNSLRYVMREVLGLKGNAYTKRMPSWIFNLSSQQIGYVLCGMFTGDGCAASKEIVIPLASRGLLQDIQSLLSVFGISFRIGKKKSDGTINAGISTVKDWRLFQHNVGFLQGYKNERVAVLCSKKSTHDNSDVIPLSNELRTSLHATFGRNARDYVHYDYNMGRSKLQRLLEGAQETALVQELKQIAFSDIMWDEVRSVEIVEYEGYVYDISVPECESFVVNNIVAHNTLELPCDALRKMGFNIQSLKVASSLAGKETSEVSATRGIRSTLRLGDSALFIGEVRSDEAIALYEAMRVGAAANVVAGTIHAASPYGVYDRVVNDIGVPRTSFKATDIIVVANPVKTAAGLRRQRRVLQITEVRKTWENDPLREHGFVDLMKYNPKKDMLEVTDELRNGESEILKEIASRVTEYAGNWDAVWDNILLRGNVKQAIVDAASKSKKVDLLEAQFVVKSNDMFHAIIEQVRQEVGGLDSKRVLMQFNAWLKHEVKGETNGTKKIEI